MLLSVNPDQTMGSLHIPKISLDLPIYHGTSEDVLQKGIGHLEGSSLPIGGRGTHTCLSAHRGLPNKRMFTNVDLLDKGDLIYLHVLDRKLAYEIFDIRTVLPEDVSYLSVKSKEDLITLITCTPYGINTHRLFITGRRVPYVPPPPQKSAVSKSWWALNWYLPVTALLLFLLFFLLFSKRREFFS